MLPFLLNVSTANKRLNHVADRKFELQYPYLAPHSFLLQLQQSSNQNPPFLLDVSTANKTADSEFDNNDKRGKPDDGELGDLSLRLPRSTVLPCSGSGLEKQFPILQV